MKNKLESILINLNKYKRTKESLLALAIEERLNKSLETYYKELNLNLKHLYSKDEVQVLKNINKL